MQIVRIVNVFRFKAKGRSLFFLINKTKQTKKKYQNHLLSNEIRRARKRLARPSLEWGPTTVLTDGTKMKNDRT